MLRAWSRPLLWGLLSLLSFLLAACSGGSSSSSPDGDAGQAPQEQKLKVAFLYVGPVGDGGWSWAHDQGRKALEQAFPWVETAYLESVPEGAQAERVLTQFAEKGYKLIFATSFGYMDAIQKVAPRYPDTVFMHCSGYKRAANVGTYFGRMYQPIYLAGLIAGRMTRTGKLGFIAPHPIPEVIRHVDAFALGVREVNPQATVHVVWTNSWFDPGKEKEAATSLLDAGADVIATGADSTAPLQAAEERGAWAFGYDSDSRRFAPHAFLTAPIWDWSVVYKQVAQEVHEGRWKSGDFWGGMETGVVKLAPLSDAVPQDVRELVEQREQEIVQGQRHVFQGPIRAQDGSLLVPEGQSMSDQDLLQLRTFVEGVVGSIPD